MARTTDRISGAAETARPYVERALTDEEIRDNVKSALAAAREVYQELVGGRGVTHVAARVATDKDIQENLRTAVDELRQAADRVQGREDHTARNTLLLVAGVALGVLFNPVTGPATRKWLTDKVFGPSGEEFTYQSSSTPSSGNSPQGGSAPSGETSS